MSLYTRIKEAWKAENLNTSTPAHAQSKESKARELENQLSERLLEPLQMFNDGLISASELVDQIVYQASLD